MKKTTLLGVAALAAAGAAGWWAAAGSRRRIETMRREAKRLLAVRRDELDALRAAAEAGEPVGDAMGPVPLDGAELDSIRFEDGLAVVVLRGSGAMAWVSSGPLGGLQKVRTTPWRGTALPGVLYAEYLGAGWYGTYALVRS